MYPISTVACALGFRLVAFAILPMVRYTGQAFLSPPNCDKVVLSEDRITGATVPPGLILPFKFHGLSVSHRLKVQISSDLCFPPPVPSPGLIISSPGPGFILVDLFWSKVYLVLECWVPYQFLDAFNRISAPKFQLLSQRLPIFSCLVSSNPHNVTTPLWAQAPSWQGINPLQKITLVCV